MRIGIATLCILTFAGIEARAQMTVEAYRTYKASTDKEFSALTAMYLKGLGDGISWLNIASGKREYCQPERLGLRLENYMDIIDKQIANFASHNPEGEVNQLMIATLLIRGLKETFPCSKATKPVKK